MKPLIVVVSFLALFVDIQRPSNSQPMGSGTSYIQKYHSCPPGTINEGSSCKVMSHLKFKQWVPTRKPGNCPSGFRYIGSWYCVSS